MKKQGILIVVSAPSGTGKTTICNEFLKSNPDVHYAVSTTTRPPRDGELNGKDYFFVTKDEFRSLIHNNAFVEYAKVYNEYYGLTKQAVISQMANGFDILVDVDTQGALSIRECIPDSVHIFLLPPSLDVLRQRLRERGKDSDEVIKLRLSRAEDEIKQSERYDYIVTNDTLDKAVCHIQSIYTAEKLRVRLNIDKIKSLLVTK